MTYANTASDAVAANRNDADAAARLPLSEWSESRRDTMNPQTVAAKHVLHVRSLALELRVRIGQHQHHSNAATADAVAAAATALLAAIGEARA